MKPHKNHVSLIISMFIFIVATGCYNNKAPSRKIQNFNKDWKFYPGDIDNAMNADFDDSSWRILTVPHDWSIEGEFDKNNPATPGGGALPGGIGWYRKTFKIPEEDSAKLVFIDFDGIYRDSEVWINGHFLGKRPFGYISFRYELTPWLNYGDKENIIAVKVDNSEQPNSRWYSGSGIYRNVYLVTTDKMHIDHYGTFITTQEVSEELAKINIEVKITSSLASSEKIKLITSVYSPEGRKIKTLSSNIEIASGDKQTVIQNFELSSPVLWSDKDPKLYTANTKIKVRGKEVDSYSTDFGIRFFEFHSQKGFLLNGKQVKINGVCNHHDLGCLGAAVNYRAMERQLEILKEMGCNGIRTSHNPPAPELLDLCDKMGFIVMNEAFDSWYKNKTTYGYWEDFGEWHKKDLEAMILRDRNHPSIFMWSIGNEILEQWDTSGVRITKELVQIVKELDTTRVITSGLNDPQPSNYLLKADVLELIGYNYKHENFESFPDSFPGKKFIASETVSALATRGYYEFPSETVRRWPVRWDLEFTGGNPDNTVSAYDHVSVPWGSTHEETWKIMKKHDFLSGMYIWTGFDYLGEPTPYSWPSRSSYFGIIDLAGFPKDSYFMYKSEWTDAPVLHIFPHWNWKKGDIVDIWAYFNADEVELFLNGKSLGVKRKENDDLHVMWKVPFIPGTLKAVSRSNGKEVLTKEIKTADIPAQLELIPDRINIKADGADLSFIAVKVLDKNGVPVPYASNEIEFELKGNGKIAGVDNGDPVSHESFKTNHRKAFHGKCLVVIQSEEEAGEIYLTAISGNLKKASVKITTVK